MNRPRHLRRRGTAGRAFGEDATLRRKVAGRRNDYGEWLPGGTLDQPIRVSTAPSAWMGGGGGRDRALELEGVRLDARRMLWTATELIAATQDTDGDLILYGGETFQVISVRPWGPDHYEAEAERQGG